MYKSNIYERLMLAFSVAVLALGTYISLNYESFENTIIPYPHIAIPILNGTCALLALFVTIFPRFYKVQAGICLVQGIVTMLNEIELLGLFLYMAGIIILYTNGYFKTRAKLKNSVLICVWVIAIFGTLPFGLHRFFRVIFLTAFYLFFYLSTYKKLEKLLVPLVSPVPLTNKKLPEKGSEIHLSDYELSQRQQDMILYFLKNDSTYEELANKFEVSVSCVKKDMHFIFSIFEVKNIKELHILLLQFVVKK